MRLADIQIVSCVFSGYRTDRDVNTYYVDLLNRLYRDTKANLCMFTNIADAFDAGIETVPVPNLQPYREMVWVDPNWQSIYHRNLGWHPRNYGLTQYSQETLVEVYLAKLGLKVEANKRFGSYLWLDAGLLNSVLGVEAHAKYNPTKFEEKFLSQMNPSQELVALRPRKFRLHKNHRPSFHGLSFNDMTKLGRNYGARPDHWYVVGGTGWLTDSVIKAIESESATVWNDLLALGRAGTEENILSVLRWKHGWTGVELEQLVSQMVG